MIIRINELKLRPDHTKRELEQEIRRTLRLKDAVLIEKNPLIEKTMSTLIQRLTIPFRFPPSGIYK